MRRFAFRLAGHLNMTVGEIERRMSAAEFREWIAFDNVDPLPDPYWSSAMLAMVIARVFGGSKTAEIADFLPARKRAKPQRQSNAMMKSLMSVFGAKQNAQVQSRKPK